MCLVLPIGLHRRKFVGAFLLLTILQLFVALSGNRHEDDPICS